MKKDFSKIKSAYDEFHRLLLSKGRLMVKDTQIGYWGISPSTELFELFQKTKLGRHKKFVDLGSGDGRAVIIADLFTDATGIEFDKELHNFAMEHAKKLNSGARLINMDFMLHPLDAYDYLFIHPDQKISDRLEHKLLSEMKKEAKLVVFGPHCHPEKMSKAETIDVQGTLVSIFRV